MVSTVPLTRDLVLVGGGHAHALVLRKWGMNPLPGARLTVINPGPTSPYTGMLPGYIAGHYSRDTLEIDLMRLAQFAGARLILDQAIGIDLKARLIRLARRDPVAYDTASIDIGITAEMDTPGFDENAVGAKPLHIYAHEWRRFLDAVEHGEKPPKVAVIGGGVAGCELAMAMAFSLRGLGAIPEVTVIEASAHITGVSPRAQANLRRAMADLGVTLLPNAHPEEITETQVILTNLPPITTSFCVGATGARPHSWIAQSDLPQHGGFVVIGPDLRVKGETNLFAVGDCAHMPFAPRPKAGVFAVRAAPVLFDNLRAALTGGSYRPFRPQKSYLKLISLGGKSALAEKYGHALAAPLLWRWKDRIDRAFMKSLEHLPAMHLPALPSIVAKDVRDEALVTPLCGGCGAKVGAVALKTGLSTVPVALHPDVLTSTGDDAAILQQPGGVFQVLSTDHLRAFVEDPVQLTRIAALHALGDIWAMGAQPQSALTNIILPRMSLSLQERTLSEINKTAHAVFTDAGASVIGGHTTMGAEMTIGFTVTGTRLEMPIALSGAQEGDVLLLTRPIGSGVILAAHMAWRAPARVAAEALDILEKPQNIAARILNAAHAMTDVTGFGLAGHLQAICSASGMQAEIWHDNVPIFEGARALSDCGIQSSLLQVNIDDTPTVGIKDLLLHDPQTAGGLLAALSPTAAKIALTKLRAEDCDGWIIGQLSKGTGPIRVC